MSLKKITLAQKVQLNKEFTDETALRYKPAMLDLNLFKDKAMKMALLDSVFRSHYVTERVLGGEDNTWKMINVLH